MLVRTFRLTDKLSNALLRILVWLSDGLLDQTYRFRLAVVGSFQALWFTVVQTLQSGRITYQSPEERRALMARRAAEAAARTALREDPLKSQNRALSMFTVALMAALLIMILWFTNNGGFSNTGLTPRVPGNSLLPLQTKGAPTIWPTTIPTTTPVPDPLSDSGSIVYSVRQNGRDNLWVLGIGQSTPIRLTNTDADDVDPVWSPRGDRIAFASRREGNWDLFILDVATGNISRLTYTLSYERAPSWSPDGAYIIYEAYDNNNVDLWLIKSDGTEGARRVTSNPAPDFSPVWSPGGRQIAYVSLRDNNQEIYVLNLDEPIEDKALRLTNTPDIDEDFPVWSPDEQTLAYSARVNGDDLVFTKPISQPQLEPSLIGRGRQPAWSPSGASVLSAVDNGSNTTLISRQIGTIGVDALAVLVQGRASRPNWTKALLPTTLVQSGGLNAVEESPLYEEKFDVGSTPPLYGFRPLQGVTAPQAILSDRVDDSFVALRLAVNDQVGFDFLGNLKESFWLPERIPEPGQSRQSWHYAGRAFDFDRFLVFNEGDQPAPIEVVREDIGVNTYWRVYIRAPEEYQNGQLGAPLKQLPWDFASRSAGDPQAYEQGGRKKVAVPAGYYIDFTQIAEDYGWQRVPSDRTWRRDYSGILYWEYNKRDELAWTDAMLEVYAKEQLSQFLSGPTPVPTSIQPTATPDTGPTWTPTPLPPDAASSG